MLLLTGTITRDEAAKLEGGLAGTVMPRGWREALTQIQELIGRQIISNCCGGRMVNGGVQCEVCGSNGL